MAGRFSVEGIFKGTDALSGVVGKVHTNFAKFQRAASRGLGQLNKAADSFASTFKNAALVTAGAAVAAGGAFALAARPGMDFEEAITAVGAVSLMTRDQISDLEKKALELGASTKFSATEAAQAMEMMGRAGFTNGEILDGIGGILSAAAAEGAGLAETASNVSNVLKGMGLATSEATRVADVLTLASARTNSSISSLGESMKNVASTARMFKIPMEDTVAAVALLQDVGLDASEAGSAVNTMLTQMAAPSAKATAQMKALGISFQDAHGNMLPLQDVFKQFEKAAQKSGGNMKQVAFFAELVGLRGQKAATNLKDLFQSGKFSQLATELQGAQGSAAKMAALRMNNLKGDLEQLGGAVETLQIGLFNMQSGPLRGIVNGIREWIEANGTLIQSKVGSYIAQLIGAIHNARFAWELFATGVKQGVSPLVAMVQMLVGPIQKVSDGLGSWPVIVQNIGRLLGVFLVFAVAVKTVTGAMLVLEVATKAVSIAWEAGTLAVRAYTFATNTAAAKAVALKVAEYASAAATWARNAAMTAAKIATTQFTLATIASTAKTAIDTTITWGRQAAQWAWNAATTAGTAAAGAFTIATITSTAKTVFDTAMTWLRAAAHGAVNAALGLAAIASGAYAIATGEATAATVAAEASLAPLLITLGAVAAAVGSLILLWKSWSDLSAQSGGLSGIWEGVKGFASDPLGGRQGFFEGVDADMNRKAKEEAARRNGPQVISPQDRTAAAINQTTNTTTTNKSELTIKDQTGKAVFTKPPPKGGGIQLASSGGM